MNFIPKRSKYKKKFKGKLLNQVSSKINKDNLCIGNIGLKAIESGVLKSKNFEAIRQSIKKIIKKAGRITFLIFPQIPKSKKPLEMRMGKGKGPIDHWVCKIKIGTIICEINTMNKALGIKALSTARFRLPIKTRLTFEK